MNTVSAYTDHVEASLRAADRYSSKCPKNLLQMEGMSGKKTRHFTIIYVQCQIHVILKLVHTAGVPFVLLFAATLSSA